MDVGMTPRYDTTTAQGMNVARHESKPAPVNVAMVSALVAGMVLKLFGSFPASRKRVAKLCVFEGLAQTFIFQTVFIL
jgi:hypothetical protein